jgi:hypothetical protein
MASLTFAMNVAFAQDSSPGPSARQEDPLKLNIGVLQGISRPADFVIEDERAAAMKTSSMRVIDNPARSSPFVRPRGPLARYERIVGDADLSVSPIELIAEKLVERYGKKLEGRRLVVREFSFVLTESVDRPQGLILIPIGPGVIGAAIVGSVVGTAIMRGVGPGRSVRLTVKLVAELDGKPLSGADFGSLVPATINELPARLTRQTFENAFYRFENPELPEPSEPASGPDTKSPSAQSPDEQKAD